MRSELDKLRDTKVGNTLFCRERLILEVTEKICEAMAEQAVSRGRLAKRLGVTRARVSQLLDGKSNMTLKSMADMLRVLGKKCTVTLENDD